MMFILHALTGSLALISGPLQLNRRILARRRQVQSLFFVTFSFWAPGLASTTLPEEVAYPLSVFLSWSLNLIVVELWLQRTRAKNDSTSSAVGRAARAPYA